MTSVRTTKIYQPPSHERTDALSGVPLASFTHRALALAIDFLIAGAVFLLVVVYGGKLAIWSGLIRPSADINLQMNFFGNWYSVVWLVAYFTLAAYWGNGKTPGKTLLRVRIVSLTHEHLGFWHTLERALGYGASTLEFGFGFFQYFLRADKRTVHDRIAETIVVFEPPRSARPESKLRKK